MNNLISSIQQEARKNYLVKQVSAEEAHENGRLVIVVVISCYYGSDAGSDIDKLVKSLRAKLPRGYSLRLKLEFAL